MAASYRLGSATQVMLCPKCLAQTILIFNMLRSSTNPASITCVALPGRDDARSLEPMNHFISPTFC
jgi:hypothetical protein